MMSLKKTFMIATTTSPFLGGLLASIQEESIVNSVSALKMYQKNFYKNINKGQLWSANRLQKKLKKLQLQRKLKKLQAANWKAVLDAFQEKLNQNSLYGSVVHDQGSKGDCYSYAITTAFNNMLQRAGHMDASYEKQREVIKKYGIGEKGNEGGHSEKILEKLAPIYNFSAKTWDGTKAEALWDYLSALQGNHQQKTFIAPFFLTKNINNSEWARFKKQAKRINDPESYVFTGDFYANEKDEERKKKRMIYANEKDEERKKKRMSGHSVVIEGVYKDSKDSNKYFIVKNSWGTDRHYLGRFLVRIDWRFDKFIEMVPLAPVTQTDLIVQNDTAQHVARIEKESSIDELETLKLLWLKAWETLPPHDIEGPSRKVINITIDDVKHIVQVSLYRTHLEIRLKAAEERIERIAQLKAGKKYLEERTNMYEKQIATWQKYVKEGVCQGRRLTSRDHMKLQDKMEVELKSLIRRKARLKLQDKMEVVVTTLEKKYLVTLVVLLDHVKKRVAAAEKVIEELQKAKKREELSRKLQEEARKKTEAEHEKRKLNEELVLHTQKLRLLREKNEQQMKKLTEMKKLLAEIKDIEAELPEFEKVLKEESQKVKKLESEQKKKADEFENLNNS